MIRTPFAIAAVAFLVAACSPETPVADAPSSAPPAAEAPAAVEAPAPVVDTLSVSNIAAGDRVTSPLRVEGVAPNNWFFEAVLPATLLVNGQVVAEAPAQAQTDWMAEGPVTFVAELVFTVDRDTPAELVLAEDMPGQDANGVDLPAREVRLPVTLVPAGQP